MAVEQAKVIDGLYNHLKGHSTFNTAVGGTAALAGRIYHGSAPRIGESDGINTMQYPYVVFFVVSSTYNDSFAKDGYSYRVQFTIMEDKEAGPRACMDVTDALRARLHRTQFTVTSHKTLAAREDVPRGPVFVDGAWQQDTDYIIEGFET